MDIMMGFTPPPIPPERKDSKGKEFEAICATDALADAVCKFELTLLSTAGPAAATQSIDGEHEEREEREIGGGALEYARQQMAQHLSKIRSLEEQLKVIPALQLQVEMLTEEKRR
uniref:Uncharacterized protein n=2 Tax=Lutzomyia longipalpis TaxID=7200 RepID=A0A1B0CCL0_LUTLO